MGLVSFTSIWLTSTLAAVGNGLPLVFSCGGDSTVSTYNSRSVRYKISMYTFQYVQANVCASEARFYKNNRETGVCSNAPVRARLVYFQK